MTVLDEKALRDCFRAIKNERPVAEMFVVHPKTLPWARIFLAWRNGIITAAERDAAWRHLDTLKLAGVIR